MSLSAIRTIVRQYADKVMNFNTANDIDPAVNQWYLTCWHELDKVAPARTRATQDLSLVADQLTAYTLTTIPLAIIEIQPPHANRNDRIFIAAVDDMDFRRNEDQARIQYAQESEASLTIRPAIDAAMTATIHYIRRPPTITSSVDQLHFDDATLAFGAIGLLLHSINFPDAFSWLDERNPKGPTGSAYTRLRNEMNTFAKFGVNSGLSCLVSGFPYQ